MKFGEVLRTPAASPADLKGQRIAESEHHGCRCSGREIVRAGFGGHAGVEYDVAGLSEGGGHASGECDEVVSESLEEREESEELFGFAACGQGDDRVSAGEHAEVSVHGVGRVEIVRGSSGRAERGGDLSSDDAALADSGDDDAVFAGDGVEKQVDGLGEGREHGAVEAKGELKEGASLDAHKL